MSYKWFPTSLEWQAQPIHTVLWYETLYIIALVATAWMAFTLGLAIGSIWAWSIKFH